MSGRVTMPPAAHRGHDGASRGSTRQTATTTRGYGILRSDHDSGQVTRCGACSKAKPAGTPLAPVII
jgi:hypothetical protein